MDEFEFHELDHEPDHERELHPSHRPPATMAMVLRYCSSLKLK